MRKLLVLFFVLALALFVQANTASADQSATKGKTEERQAKTQDSVSSEDLDKMSQKIDRLTREMKSADKKSADRLKAEREESRKQLESLKKSFETQQAAQAENFKKLEAARAAERAKDDEVARKYFYGAVAGFAIIVSLVIGGFVVGKRKALAVEGAMPQTHSTGLHLVPKTRFVIHGKTEKHTIRTFVEETPNLKAILASEGEVKIPCTLELPFKEGSELNGMKFDCIAILKKDGEVNIRFEDRPLELCAWKNRNVKAAEIGEAKKNAA